MSDLGSSVLDHSDRDAHLKRCIYMNTKYFEVDHTSLSHASLNFSIVTRIKSGNESKPLTLFAGVSPLRESMWLL